MKTMSIPEAKLTYKAIFIGEAQRVSSQIFTLIEALIEDGEEDDIIKELMNEWTIERQTWVDGIKECD